MLLGIDNYLKKYRQGDEALIVNIASVAGIKGYGYMPIYCATKFAINGRYLNVLLQLQLLKNTIVIYTS